MSRKTGYIHFPWARDLSGAVRLIGRKELLEREHSFYGIERQNGEQFHLYEMESGEIVAFPEELEEAL